MYNQANIMHPKKTPSIANAEQLLFFLVLSASAFALPLDLTINERVGLNQTFYQYPAATESGGITTAYGAITITNYAGERVSDISIFLNNTATFNQTPVKQSGANGYASGSQGSIITIHIPALEASGGNSQSVWNYTINATSLSAPVNVEVSHFPTRVVFGTSFNATLNLTSVLSSGRIFVNMTQDAANSFQFQGVSSNSDGSVPTDTTSSIVWNNVQLDPAERDTLKFRVLAPSVSSTAYYTFSNANLKYAINETATGVTVLNVTAGGQVLVQAKKERFSGGVWNVTPSVQNIATNLTYNLTQFSTWSTLSPAEPGGGVDPGAAKMPGSSYQWNASVILAPGQSWTNASLSFINTSVPLVWSKAVYRLVSQNISQSLAASNATYIYIQQMYVIKGYAVRITKLLKPLSTADTYNVTINITNVGDDNTTEPVYMADIAPANFSINASKMLINSYTWNGTALNPTSDKPAPSNVLYSMYNGLNFTGNQSITAGEFASTVVWYWALKAIRTNETIIVNYELAGSGDYRFFDAVIIGVDPARVFGHGVGNPIFYASEMIAARSPEALLIIATLLLGIGVIIKARRPKDYYPA